MQYMQDICWFFVVKLMGMEYCPFKSIVAAVETLDILVPACCNEYGVLYLLMLIYFDSLRMIIHLRMIIYVEKRKGSFTNSHNLEENGTRGVRRKGSFTNSPFGQGHGPSATWATHDVNSILGCWTAENHYRWYKSG